MYEAELKIKCKNPLYVKESLEPDIKNGKDVKTEIEATKSFLVLKIKSKKLSYLKAIINSYIGLISMLVEIDKVK